MAKKPPEKTEQYDGKTAANIIRTEGIDMLHAGILACLGDRDDPGLMSLLSLAESLQQAATTFEESGQDDTGTD